MNRDNIYDPRFVKNLFNSMSSSYERMNYITSFGFSIRWRKQSIKQIQKTDQPIKVLDILSGQGENWPFLIKAFPNADLFALDFSEKMVSISRSKSLHKMNNRITVLQQDLLNNNLLNDQYDLVTCAYGLKTFNNEQLNQIAKTICRILKPNGRFTFVEVSKPQNKLLRFFYAFYLGKVIPILGKLCLGNPQDYKMLWIYARYFNNCKEVKKVFEKNKLIVNYDTYFFGCATGISGYKAK